MGIRDTELTTLMKHLQYLGTDRDLAGGQVIEGVSGERTGKGGGGLHQLTAVMETSTVPF